MFLIIIGPSVSSPCSSILLSAFNQMFSLFLVIPFQSFSELLSGNSLLPFFSSFQFYFSFVPLNREHRRREETPTSVTIFSVNFLPTIFIYLSSPTDLYHPFCTTLDRRVERNYVGFTAHFIEHLLGLSISVTIEI